MQQMNPQKATQEWQSPYSGYTGSEQAPTSPGQKLDVDGDEQFADMLVRRLKQDLKSEVRTEPILGYRVALAIVSVIAMVPIFGMFIWALSLKLGDAAIGLSWGFVALCALILFVNLIFNQASSNANKTPNTARNDNIKENRT